MWSWTVHFTVKMNSGKTSKSEKDKKPRSQTRSSLGSNRAISTKNLWKSSFLVWYQSLPGFQSMVSESNFYQMSYLDSRLEFTDYRKVIIDSHWLDVFKQFIPTYSMVRWVKWWPCTPRMSPYDYVIRSDLSCKFMVGR